MLFGKYVNKYYGKYFWFFFFGVLALILVDFFQLLIPQIFGDLVDGISDESIFEDMSILTTSVLYIGLIAIVMFIGRFTWRICIFGVGVRIESDMRDEMFLHSETLSYSFYKKHKTGALMALYTNDLQTIRSFFGQGTIMLIDFIFLGSIALIKMFLLNWMLTCVILVPAIGIGIASFFLGKRMEDKFKVRQMAYENLSDFTQENFTGISVIKAFVKESEERREFLRINEDNYEKNMSFLRYYMILNVFITVILNLIISVLFAGGVYLIAGTDINFTIGNLTAFVSYFNSLTWPMMAIGQLINLRSQAKASLTRVSELLDEKPEIVDEGIVESQIEGKITFNHLTFQYNDADTPILKDITFTIEKGQMVGILGKTGSGKSTLVDLLLRMYNLDSEALLLDDIDIMKLPYKKVRESIGYVPQDNFLFSDTVRNNIAFAFSGDVADDDIVRSAIMSDVHDNIIEFKEGYQTILGERGVTLSGGQKQRVSIARALIKNPPIMIFDDSVSAVDTKTEEKILTNLRDLRKGKTTIMVSHRISTVKDLDVIILLDEGKVVGIGNNDSLLKTNKLYQEMVRLQTLEEEVNS